MKKNIIILFLSAISILSLSYGIYQGKQAEKVKQEVERLQEAAMKAADHAEKMVAKAHEQYLKELEQKQNVANSPSTEPVE